MAIIFLTQTVPHINFSECDRFEETFSHATEITLERQILHLKRLDHLLLLNKMLLKYSYHFIIGMVDRHTDSEHL
jgi:hypothetical protein